MNDFNIQSLIKEILISKGANEFWSQILSFGISFILIFLSSLLIYFVSKKIIVKIPNRLVEGYGPNIRIMDEMLAKDVKLMFLSAGLN